MMLWLKTTNNVFFFFEGGGGGGGGGGVWRREVSFWFLFQWQEFGIAFNIGLHWKVYMKIKICSL